MRNALDNYPTPGRLTQALIDRVPIGGIVLEPCAGTGQIADVLWQHPAVSHVLLNDIDPGYGIGGHNAADPGSYLWTAGSVDWIVTNPPFKLAMPILANAWGAARVGVAFLLRLSFLEPTNGRKSWLQEHAGKLSDLLVFGSPRPSFTDDGRTDSATVAWMVWRRNWPTGTRVCFVGGWNTPGVGLAGDQEVV